MGARPARGSTRRASCTRSTTPLDVLRFRALSLIDRLRTGLGALYITRAVRDGLPLDDVPVADWPRRIFGAPCSTSIWGPLLRAKFGERFTTVPAYWVWNTLTREKNGSQGVKGYLRGGYALLGTALRDAIVRGGGEVRLRSPITGIGRRSGRGLDRERRAAARATRGRVDAAHAAAREASRAAAVASQIPLSELSYQGGRQRRRRVARAGWSTSTGRSSSTRVSRSQGVVETTHVIPPEWLGGRHLIYVMNYCDAGSEIYARSDELVKRQAVEGLCALLSRFHAGRRRGGVRVPRAARRAGLDGRATCANGRRRASATRGSISAPPRRHIRASPPGIPA